MRINLLIISLLFLVSVQESIAQGTANSSKKEINLEEIWASGIFSADYVYGLESMNDGEHYTQLERNKSGQSINKYAYKTGEKVATILNSSDLVIPGRESSLNIDAYQLSEDETKILVATESENIYRHSTIENYFVYDLKAKTLEALSIAGKQRLASFSPDGNKVAFVRENNLYYKDLESKKEVQITFDGRFNSIINGATDWVYEEEFGFAKGFDWSSDGSKIAYYRFDESAVKEFSMPLYGDLYPELYTYKYPKAGEENAKVSIYIYELNSNKSEKINELGAYEYIPRIKWMSAEYLCVFTLNRHQNLLKLFQCEKTGKAKIFYEETSNTYIDINDDLTFLANGKNFIFSSEKDGFNHLYLRSIDGKNETQITKGNWEVSKFYGFNEKSKILYYQAAAKVPMEREIYASNLKGKQVELSKKSGSNEASFSKGFKYFINFHSTISQPYTITLQQSDGKVVRNLVENETLKATLETYKMGETQFFDFTTSEFQKLNYWMLRPADFDPAKKYPVLMYVYGGPGSQTVENKWGSRNYLWYQMLASKGYIVVSVDGRGTGARGADFKKSTYKNLGGLETIDQIEAAKFLKTLPYIDSERIGIWGWSFGGYMTALCMMKGADVFKTGISVAPVTNWRFYDSIYTERFLQTPQENAAGYDNNSPINFANQLEGNFLLIHGSADDNVHHQNAMELNMALVNANKDFDFMLYPNKNHGIYGGFTRLHLFNKMTNFILENL